MGRAMCGLTACVVALPLLGTGMWGCAREAAPPGPRRLDDAPPAEAPLARRLVAEPTRPRGESASRPALLMRDDFKGYDRGSDASPMWIGDSGEWTVTEEGLDRGFRGTDCGGSFIALGARSGRREWTDYTLSLELRVVSRASDWRDGAWIGFRYRDSLNAYTLAFYDRSAALHKASKGKVTSDKGHLAQSETTITDDRWHAVKITARDTKITVALDGNVIIEATDDDWNGSPPVASGGVVLAARKYENATGSTQVVFKNVRVEAVGDVPEGMRYTMQDARDAAARDSRKVSMLEFIRSRRARRYARVPRKVLAFYYTWYGTPERQGRWVHWDGVDPERHEIATSTNYPAKGAYDSHDTEIIDWHMDLAKQHGIDAFICTWWGRETFDDRALVKVLDRAERKGLEVTIYWETAPGKGRAKISRAVDDLVYAVEKYGSHPAFLKVDGKPVVFVYGRLMGQVAMAEWPEIITLARERCGKDFLLIADGYREEYARVFDGIHVYNICGWVQGKTAAELTLASRESFRRAVRMAKDRARISCITIIPGYDDTKIRKPGIDAERLGGETYRVLWEEAIAADPDWVLITSFNEWHEGSEVEPSWEDGDKYIKMTGRYARAFKSRPWSRVPIPETPPGASPEQARELREMFARAKVGLLPGFGGQAALWLAETGVDVQELTWRDVLDPERFNVGEYPVVIFAGEESYVQTLRETGDVDDAIVRYLREGGLLMALPTGPFPFYYNEKKEAVVSAGRFGFPVCGSGAFGRPDVDPDAVAKGWEEPPAGVKLVFKIDSEHLQGLPASAAFPDAGDLRWRPSTGAVLPEGDVYLRLAKLVQEDGGGEGRDYGDGIVYIEHRVSEPKGGKNIYVWKRMADVLDGDAFLFALFRLAAEKMTRTR